VNQCKRILTAITFSMLFGSDSSVLADTVTMNYLVVDTLATPFQITDQGESRGGIISRLVDAIAQDVGFTVHPVVSSPERISKLANENHLVPWISYDAKPWNSLTPNGEILAEPLFDVRHVLLTCRDNLIALEELSKSDFEGLNVAILKGFHYPELTAMEKRGSLSLTIVRDYNQGFTMTRLGRVDGFVEMSTRLKYNLRSLNQQSSCFRLLDADVLIAPYPIFLSVNRNMPEHLRNRILTSIKQLKKGGKIKRIIEHYTRD